MLARPLDTGCRVDGDRRARAILAYALSIAICGSILHHIPGLHSYRSWLLTPFQPVLAATGTVRAALIAAASSRASLGDDSLDGASLRMNYAATQVRAAQLESELNSLRASIGMGAVTGFTGVTASVTAGSSGFEQRTLMIDKGLVHGVRTGSIVLGSGEGGRVGIVGRVIEAGPAMAKVLTILDPSCRVSVRLKGEEGFVYAGSAQRSTGKLDFVPRDLAVSVGDPIVTAAEGSLFPADFAIGEIASLGAGNGVFHDLRVKPVVDIAGARYVWVMTRERGSMSSRERANGQRERSIEAASGPASGDAPGAAPEGEADAARVLPADVVPEARP